MLLPRALVVIFLLPLVIAIIMVGGPWFLGASLLVLAIATWEYAQLYRLADRQPAVWLMVAAVLLIAGVRFWAGAAHDAALITLTLFVVMAFHVRAYARGREQAATDFAASLSGIFYVGFLGSYWFLMRALPDGAWWLLLTFAISWVADIAAYLFGSRFGKSRISASLSSHKSWEGFAASLVFGVALAPILMMVFRPFGLPAAPGFTSVNAAILGLAVSTLPLLGDLGESMIKRQAGAKDSGGLLPGHGGILDRIDSWLWAIPIGYYLVTWVFI